MNKFTRLFFWFCLTLSVLSFDIAKAEISPFHTIQSKELGYKVQYKVYLPRNYQKLESLPTLYLTDGQMFIEHGKIEQILDKLIQEKKIRPVMVVLVDSRNPDKLEQDRRRYELMCNTAYIDFFVNELVPAIDQSYKSSRVQKDRAILGLSFGGLNSACFGLLAYQQFHGIGMLSPALHPMPKIYDFYQSSERLPLNFFISTGKIDDNESDTRRFVNIIKYKGYPIKFKVVKQGHNWKNWKPLIDDFLLYFYSSSSS